jgi:hypothetical protein
MAIRMNTIVRLHIRKSQNQDLRDLRINIITIDFVVRVWPMPFISRTVARTIQILKKSIVIRSNKQDFNYL